MQTILVTGGAGYIGSHTCLELLQLGYNVIVVDNLTNSKRESLYRVEELSKNKVSFFKIDLNEHEKLDDVFLNRNIEGVIHFAGYKAVGESVKKPLLYYENNVASSISLFQCMQKHGVKNIVFSSSCTIYGEPERVPIKENDAEDPINPYGRTKWFIEQILQDIKHTDPEWNISILRYFNPIGAHTTGKIGEDPTGEPNNLMPYIAQVATGKRDKMYVFGDDYNTHDGTGVRDYIHVLDLARAHVKALEEIESHGGLNIFNLGTGTGYSVLDVIKSFKKVSGQKISYEIINRRPGDAATVYANPERANQVLKWSCKYGLDEMCKHTWKWQKDNPDGY